MKKRLLCLLFVLCCFTFSIESYAGKLTPLQRADLEAAKQQHKSQKKFNKKQKKAQKKQLKQAKKLRHRRAA